MIMRSNARPLLLSTLLAVATPLAAGTVDDAVLEARVDRLLWQIVNDARYSHLQVAANYERLRAILLAQPCRVSAAPCATGDRLPYQGRTPTTALAPEQERAIEQLLFSFHGDRTAVSLPPSSLMITATE